MTATIAPPDCPFHDDRDITAADALLDADPLVDDFAELDVAEEMSANPESTQCPCGHTESPLRSALQNPLV